MGQQREPARAGVEQLAAEIRAGLPSAPAGMSQDDFTRLCDNIASAILRAIAAHLQRDHRQAPDFGEPID